MKTQKELKAKIKLAAERMADRERRECYGFIYQPMRPSNKETNVSKTET